MNSRYFDTMYPPTLRDLAFLLFCHRARPAPALSWVSLKALAWFPQVFEAYGQTECTAGCTLTSPGDWKPGRLPICWAGGAVVGRRVLVELGLMSLDNLSASDECGQSQLRFWSRPSYLGRWFFSLYFYSQSISIPEICLERSVLWLPS